MILSELFKTQSRFNRSTSQYRMDLFVQVFENNYSHIISFLPFS